MYRKYIKYSEKRQSYYINIDGCRHRSFTYYHEAEEYLRNLGDWE